MSVYTVQVPLDSFGEPAVEKAVFLPEGFSWPAFVFGLLWLLWYRLWAIVALWLAACALLTWLALWNFGFGMTFLIALALQLLLGLEANALLRHKLSRQRYRLLDVVNAEAPELAEHSFFTRHMPMQTDHLPVLKSPQPSVLPTGTDNEVLGLFPLPEDRR